jgi:hypothetical protein
MEIEEQRFLIKHFWMKNPGSKNIHHEAVTTLGTDADGLS